VNGESPLDPRPLELPTLPGRNVRLRAFTPEDAGAVQEASWDDLIPLITSVPSTADHTAAIAFLDRQHARLVTRAGYSFAIADAASDEAVGQIGLWPREIDQGRASVGYWIRPTARRKGHAADALATLVDWSRTLPHVHRLELYVEPWNVGSWRTAESAGFQREGLLRRWQSVGGEHRDMYLYSLLPS